MKHHLFHIVAVSGNAAAGEGVIGKDNQLPWPKFSEDLKFFKATTAGNTVIMGRKTFESIGKTLPDRENFVISHSDLNVPGVKFFHSIEEAIEKAPTEKIFIIGGAEIFRRTIHQIEGIYLTQVKGSYQGDARYPAVPKTFQENKEESKHLQEKFKIPVIYLENTAFRAISR